MSKAERLASTLLWVSHPTRLHAHCMLHPGVPSLSDAVGAGSPTPKTPQLPAGMCSSHPTPAGWWGPCHGASIPAPPSASPSSHTFAAKGPSPRSCGCGPATAHTSPVPASTPAAPVIGSCSPAQAVPRRVCFQACGAAWSARPSPLQLISPQSSCRPATARARPVPRPSPWRGL
jgi:hypothetical protein